MPANYPPDPTATQAPATAPDPDDFPLEALPLSGEGCTAASIAQAFKVLGDYIAWLKKPRAKANAFAQALRRYADARLRERFIIDHYGKPGGEYFAWRETFGPRTPWLHTAGASGTVVGTSGNKWALNQTGAGIIGVNAPGIAAGLNFSDTHPTLSLDIDNAGANVMEMLLDDDCNSMIWSANMLATLDYSLMPFTVTDATWVHGVCGQAEHVNTIAHGAFFIRANVPGSTWHARTINGGAPTDTDTGVAGTAGAGHHFKLDMVGSAIDDGAANRVVFLVDGVEKANHTLNIPLTSRLYPVFGGFSGGAIGGTQRLLVGPPNWSQNTRVSTP